MRWSIRFVSLVVASDQSNCSLLLVFVALQMPIAWTAHLDHSLHALLASLSSASPMHVLEDNDAIVTGATTTAQHLAVFAGLAGMSNADRAISFRVLPVWICLACFVFVTNRFIKRRGSMYCSFMYF